MFRLETAYRYFFLSAIVYLFLPTQSFAFGISPSRIDLGDIYRGETVIKEINITTHKDEREIISGFKITTTDDTGLVLHDEEVKREDKESSFVVLPLTIQTEKAVKGSNTVVLSITPLYIDREEMVALSLSLPLEIQFTVAETKKEHAFIEDVSISEDKKGENIRFSLYNEGNSTVNIKNPQIAFLNNIISLDIEGNVPVGMSKTFSAHIDTTEMDFGRHPAILRFPHNSTIEEYGFSYHKYSPSYQLLQNKNESGRSLVAGLLALAMALIGFSLLRDKKTL